MAKGLIKDSTLTAIANAIREKTETTATMLPSEMAALIQGLSNVKVTYGTITPTKAPSSITITHDLGATPNVIYVCQLSSRIHLTKSVLAIVLWPDVTGWVGIIDINGDAQRKAIDSDTISSYITELTGTSMTLNAPTGNYSATFMGTYYWLVGAI